jgi:hypothetical protein
MHGFQSFGQAMKLGFELVDVVSLFWVACIHERVQTPFRDTLKEVVCVCMSETRMMC